MQCTTRWPVGLVFCTLLLSASVGAEGRHCDRSKRYEALSEQSRQALQQGQMVSEVQKDPTSEYHLGYVYKLVAHPPEVVMAVFTNYPEHKDYITNILAANVEAQSVNKARVRFVYNLPWPLPDSEYVLNDTVEQEGDTYLLYWNLHPSSPSGMSAPKHVEGYFRTQPVGPHTLIIYCNYVIPSTTLLPGKINSDGLKAMQTTLHDTVRWVDTIAAEPAASVQNIARLRAMLPR
jgi:hypothetical protein